MFFFFYAHYNTDGLKEKESPHKCGQYPNYENSILLLKEVLVHLSFHWLIMKLCLLTSQYQKFQK